VRAPVSPSDEKNVFEADSISVGYAPTRPIINGLSFSVRRGEIAALVGPSGIGKTTLLRTLSGLLPPLGGEIVLEGSPINGPSRRLTMVFQDYSRSLLPWMTVRKNIELVLESARLGRRERQARGGGAGAAVGRAGGGAQKTLAL